MNPENDGLDIPAFLVLSQEERARAWRDWPAFPNQPKAVLEDRGPGSVARRLGCPESPLDAIARAEITAGILRAAEAKKAENLARLAALKAEQKAERAEMQAVRAAARAQHHQEILKD